MSPPRNGSGASGPEAPADLARELLHRRGVAAQRGGTWRGAICVQLRDNLLCLVPLDPGVASFGFASGQPAVFQVPQATGLLRLVGIARDDVQLRVDGMTRRVTPLEFAADRIERVNRRQHFRIASDLKGEVAFPAREQLEAVAQVQRARRPLPHLEALAARVADSRKPCRIRDISLGGARLRTVSPLPDSGQAGLLDLAFGPGDLLRNLEVTVVQAWRSATGSTLDVTVRVRFGRIAAAAEARLARFVNQVQLELLRRGRRG